MISVMYIHVHGFKGHSDLSIPMDKYKDKATLSPYKKLGVNSQSVC